MTLQRTLPFAALLLGIAAPLGAQTLRYLDRTGGYASFGVGGGNFTFECDSLCAETKRGGSHGHLTLGRHFGRRVRLEVGLQIMSHRDDGSNLRQWTAGAATYLAGNLFVRGAATWFNPSISDSLGSLDGSGGPGFLVGAGYDLHLIGRLAVTPYVNYTAGSVSRLTRTAGGVDTPTAGSTRSLNFGLSLTVRNGNYLCTTASGDRIWLSRRNRSQFLSCLDQVEARLGRTRFRR